MLCACARAYVVEILFRLYKLIVTSHRFAEQIDLSPVICDLFDFTQIKIENCHCVPFGTTAAAAVAVADAYQTKLQFADCW